MKSDFHKGSRRAARPQYKGMQSAELMQDKKCWRVEDVVRVGGLTMELIISNLAELYAPPKDQSTSPEERSSAYRSPEELAIMAESIKARRQQTVVINA